MEKWIAIRDTVLWWMGCWLACNLVTNAISWVKARLERRRMQKAARRLLQKKRQASQAIGGVTPAIETHPAARVVQAGEDTAVQPTEEGAVNGADS